MRLLLVGGTLTLIRSSAAAQRECVDVGHVLLAGKLKASARPGPAAEAVRHRAGDVVARACAGGERRQRQRRQTRKGELAIAPARLGELPGARIACRNAPQIERRRPQAEAEDHLGGFRRRVRPDMRADRRAGRRADRRHPAQVLLGGVLGLLVHRERIARGDEAERVVGAGLRHRHLVGDGAEVRRHAVGERGADAVAHLDMVAKDCDPAVPVDFHAPQ